jgi:LDH2 family malate/lactate/ureidoglycolate dehydrogenase
MKCNSQDLKNFGIEIMKKVGLNEKDAKVFLDSLVLAEMRGVSSHGITRLKAYSDRIKAGDIAVNTIPKIVSESDSIFVVDGKNGPGMTVGITVMEKCVEKAKKTGVCLAAVHNSSHYGFGGYYAMYAADRNMVGFSACNADAAVVPFGGAKPMLGTNPLSVAIPANRHPNLVLDMATSVVAKGKIHLYEKLGKAVPNTWIVDKDGKPSTNPADILEGALLPFGGVKGYAISLIIDILCSALSGAKDSRQISSFFSCPDSRNFQNVGFLMGAIAIEKFIAIDLFKDRVDQMFDEIKQCPPAPGFSNVLIPGELEQAFYTKNASEGIELSSQIVEELIGLAGQYGLQHPFK